MRIQHEQEIIRRVLARIQSSGVILDGTDLFKNTHILHEFGFPIVCRYESEFLKFQIHFFKGPADPALKTTPLSIGDLQVALVMEGNRPWMQDLVRTSIAIEKFIEDHPTPEEMVSHLSSSPDKEAVVFLGIYELNSYPCIPGPDGEKRKVRRFGFRVAHQIQGTIACRDIDVTLDALRDRAFVPHRAYLVVLKPSEKTRPIMNRSDGLFSMFSALGPEEVIEIKSISPET